MKSICSTIRFVAMLIAVAPGFCAAGDFEITRFGAVAESSSSCEAAIQKAIDEASLAGGRVVVPKGRFVAGPIRLKSKVELYLAEGSVLVMNDDPSKFPVSNKGRPAFISAEKSSDIRISGKGIIDGQGPRWWKVYLDEKKAGVEAAPRRPQLIAFNNCERVSVEAVTTLNPPNTHYSFKNCQKLTIRGIHADAPDDSPNTDALNLSNVRDVLIENCSISTGDDNIVLLCGTGKNPGQPEVENITIRNCKLGFGHGLSIGSYIGGGVKNVIVENINFDHTTSGIRMKASRDRGGVVEGIRYKNITMRDVRFPIHITSYYPKPPSNPSEDLPFDGQKQNPVWRDIVIEDVTMTNCRNSIVLWGLPDEPIRNVTFKNVSVSAKTGARVYHSEGVTFENTTITPESGPALRLYKAKVEGMTGVEETGQKIRFE